MGKVEQPGYLLMGTLESRHKVEQRLSNKESGMSNCRAIKRKVSDRHGDEKRKKQQRSLSFLYVRNLLLSLLLHR